MSWTHKKPDKPKFLCLKCRLCKQNRIPWLEGQVGCPPEYCPVCSEKLGKNDMIKYERKDKPLSRTKKHREDLRGRNAR